MASVFLSYDHQDADKARVVARSLESAGHQVWWDRHIRGGAQYAQEIEQAIERSDAIVVLWSRRSAVSEWVRDEAAAGRDRQRLVPARIDPIDPPMGFRQFQTIDLTGWTGRKRTAALKELERAVAALSGAPHVDSIEPADRSWLSRRSVFASVSAALLALVAAGLWMRQPWQQPAAPVVTVEARDTNPASRAIANSLLVQLGSLQASRADLLQLSEPGAGINPDLVLKVAAHPERDGSGSASVALLQARTSTLLWSKEFGGDDIAEADLRQQIAYATAKVLECAAEGRSAGGKALKAQTYKLFLNGCVELTMAGGGEVPGLLLTFRKITTEAPGFAGGWSRLLDVRIDELMLAGLDDSQVRRELRSDVNQARKFHPTLVEAYLAEGWLQPPRPISGWMRLAEKAVEADPNHPSALLQRATGLMHLGRMKEAVVDSRKAVQFDPLSSNRRNALIYALVEAGEDAAARKELAEVERLWPGSRSAVSGQFMVESRIGDPRRALAMARSGELPMPVAPTRLASLEARVAGTPGAIELAVQQARQQYSESSVDGLGPYFQALAEFRRTEEAIQLMLSADPAESPGAIAYMFRPAFREIHADRRFMRIAGRFGLIDFWRESGSWPDFCARTDLPYDCKSEAQRALTR